MPMAPRARGSLALSMGAHAPPLQKSGGETTGTVKSYSDRHGYGFINAPGHQVDIKFSRADLVGTETVPRGASVHFVPVTSPDGRVQAKQVQLAGQGAKRPFAAAALGNGYGGAAKQQRIAIASPAPAVPMGSMSTGQVCEGTVKSYI